MGNYISCSLSTSGGKHTTNVVLADGRIIHVSSRGGSHPAAEFMLDYPGNFLVNSRSLHVGRRFSAMSADEELEVGHAYVMFPLERVNSVVNAADMAKLVMVAGKTARQARVVPALMPVVPTEETRCYKLEAMDGELVAEVRGRMSACRSRKPMLETIEEEDSSFVCSRRNTLAGLFLMDLD